MTTSGALRKAVDNLEHSLTAIKDPTTSHLNRLWRLRQAEQQLAAIRAIVEAEPQAAAIEQRYGTPEPPSIRDWWTK